MIKKQKIQRIIKPMLCGLCLVLTGCSAASLAQESTFESAYENGAQEEKIDIYTSAASVIIKAVNEEDQTVSMYLVDRNESRDFSYNGATIVQDKFGSAMTIGQLTPGDIAEITYNSELERAGSITLSPEAFSYEGVEKYSLNAGNGSVTIGDETFSIGSNVMVFSDGRSIDISQIIHQDVLTFRGKGHNIMSITVDKGHGYLELKNDEAVLGSWIEVGQAAICQIEPDMLITVPEGSYTIRITGTGIEEVREVAINRNKETVLDLGDIKVQEPQTGIVVFDVTPDTATVYVDDEEVDAAYSVKVPLGLHLVRAEASGYESLSQYFKIEAGKNKVTMKLEEESTVSGNSFASTEKESGKLTIEAPEGVEVYQDNLYMGIAPVTYVKTAGEHTITLRKTGYITRSHTIFVTDDDNDVTYAFPDLDPVDGQSTVSGNNVNGASAGQTVSGNSTGETVSGNSVSGNSITDSAR